MIFQSRQNRCSCCLCGVLTGQLRELALATTTLFIEVIWQYRDKTSVPVLASALREPHPEVLRHALDGLVTTGGIKSHAALIDFRSELAEDSDQASWVNGAIGQIQL